MEDETTSERPPVFEATEKASEAESTARPAPCGWPDPREADLDALIHRHGGRPGASVVSFPVDRVNRRK